MLQRQPIACDVSRVAAMREPGSRYRNASAASGSRLSGTAAGAAESRRADPSAGRVCCAGSACRRGRQWHAQPQEAAEPAPSCPPCREQAEHPDQREVVAVGRQPRGREQGLETPSRKSCTGHLSEVRRGSDCDTTAVPVEGVQAWYARPERYLLRLWWRDLPPDDDECVRIGSAGDADVGVGYPDSPGRCSATHASTSAVSHTLPCARSAKGAGNHRGW